MRLRRSQRRRGATLVESAIVYPATFLLLVGMLVGALGIFRYQQVAALARETARYASVHGAEYGRVTKTTPPTPAQIFDAVYAERAADLEREHVTYSITYNTSNEPYRTAIVNGNVTTVTNVVTVTVSFQWIPEAYFGGATLSATATTQMLY